MLRESNFEPTAKNQEEEKFSLPGLYSQILEEHPPLDPSEEERLMSTMVEVSKNKSPEQERQELLLMEEKRLKGIISHRRRTEKQKEQAREKLRQIRTEEENKEKNLRKIVEGSNSQQEKNQAREKLNQIKQAREKIKSGAEARKRLSEGYLRFVVMLAGEWDEKLKKFGVHNVSKQDIISLGNEALVKASKSFDPEKGFKFSSYLGSAINHMVMNHLKKIKKIPLHLSLEDRGTARSNKPISETIEDTNSPTPEKIIEEEENSLKRSKLISFLDQLGDRKRKIITMHFGLGEGKDAKEHSLREIGKELGISPERVCQLEREALEKLKITMNRELRLDDYT